MNYIKKEKIFTKKIFFVFLLSILFCIGAKSSSAAYITSEQCVAGGGTCNWISNNCSSDETSIGLCQGGPLSQGACCKKTSGASTGKCAGTCRSIVTESGSTCDEDENYTGTTGCATGEGCCEAKSTTPVGTGTTSPSTTNPTGTGSSPTGTTNPTGTGTGSTGARTGSTGGLVPCTDDCTLCHIVLGFKNIYDYLLTLLLAATTVVIVIAGIMYMISSGSKGMIDKAKSAFTYALTAMILALTAWLIINATLNALGYNNAGNWWTFTCDTTQATPQTGTGSGGSTLPGSGNTGGTGCAAVVNNINSMSGWKYVPGSWANGSGDCSSTTSRAYTNAGCKNPGSTSGQIYNNAQAFSGNASTLKAGDALVRIGHVGICLVDGCSRIMGASTASGIHPSSGSSMINASNVRVIKVSDYCPASSC